MQPLLIRFLFEYGNCIIEENIHNFRNLNKIWMKVHRNTLVHSVVVHACSDEVIDLGKVQMIYEELNEGRHVNCERKEAK